MEDNSHPVAAILYPTTVSYSVLLRRWASIEIERISIYVSLVHSPHEMAAIVYPWIEFFLVSKMQFLGIESGQKYEIKK